MNAHARQTERPPKPTALIVNSYGGFAVHLNSLLASQGFDVLFASRYQEDHFRGFTWNPDDEKMPALKPELKFDVAVWLGDERVYQPHHDVRETRIGMTETTGAIRSFRELKRGGHLNNGARLCFVASFPGGKMPSDRPRSAAAKAALKGLVRQVTRESAGDEVVVTGVAHKVLRLGLTPGGPAVEPDHEGYLSPLSSRPGLDRLGETWSGLERLLRPSSHVFGDLSAAIIDCCVGKQPTPGQILTLDFETPGFRRTSSQSGPEPSADSGLGLRQSG